MYCACVGWITQFFTCPGLTPSPTAPGCKSGSPQRQNMSAPAGAASKTGTTFSHYVQNAPVCTCSHLHTVFVPVSFFAFQALPLGKQVEPKRAALCKPVAGGFPQTQHWRGWIHQNFPGEKGRGWLHIELQLWWGNNGGEAD